MALVTNDENLQRLKTLQTETEKVDKVWKCSSFKCQRQVQESCITKDGAICDKN